MWQSGRSDPVAHVEQSDRSANRYAGADDEGREGHMILVTGASGFLGRALIKRLPDARGVSSQEWDLNRPESCGGSGQYPNRFSMVRTFSHFRSRLCPVLHVPGGNWNGIRHIAARLTDEPQRRARTLCKGSWWIESLLGLLRHRSRASRPRDERRLGCAIRENPSYGTPLRTTRNT
jgi:hypothetical protein